MGNIRGEKGRFYGDEDSWLWEHGHLKCIGDRNGLDDLTSVLRYKCNSSIRVTSSSKIILAVFYYFSKQAFYERTIS